MSGEWDKLGHCYDPMTGTFSTAIIGSFYKFEKAVTDTGCSLIGYARIMKRNEKVCEAIAGLFARNALKFSFEIACGKWEERDDGVFVIGKDSSNYLEGMCVVSFPACPEAVAMQLVAELFGRKEAEPLGGIDEVKEIVAEQAEEVSAEVAEEAHAETAAEEVQACTETETHDKQACDNPDTKEEQACTEPEGNKEETAEAQTETAEAAVVEIETPNERLAEAEHQVAEISNKMTDALTELANEIKQLRAEIEELKKEPEAKEAPEPEGEHPFMAEIKMNNGWSLLQKQEHKEYDLLGKRED